MCSEQSVAVVVTVEVIRDAVLIRVARIHRGAECVYVDALARGRDAVAVVVVVEDIGEPIAVRVSRGFKGVRDRVAIAVDREGLARRLNAAVIPIGCTVAGSTRRTRVWLRTAAAGIDVQGAGPRGALHEDESAAATTARALVGVRVATRAPQRVHGVAVRGLRRA